MSPTAKFVFKLVVITVAYVAGHIYLNKATLWALDVAAEEFGAETPKEIA